jgi:DNA-binding FadR family transcriptional regulator
VTPAERQDTRRLASEGVHDRLRGEILSGALPAGAALPSERALAEAGGVNRHAVREAVKRLQQAGLVQVSHGGATRVLDWRRTGGLELLGDLAAHAGERVLRDVAQMRVSIGADAARLCAGRADDETLAAVTGGAAAHAAAGGFEERLIAYEALWSAIVEGSGNLAYRLAYNALVAARHEGGGIDPRVYAGELEDPAASGRLAAAIGARDADGAHRAAQRLLARTVDRAA